MKNILNLPIPLGVLLGLLASSGAIADGQAHAAVEQLVEEFNASASKDPAIAIERCKDLGHIFSCDLGEISSAVIRVEGARVFGVGLYFYGIGAEEAHFARASKTLVEVLQKEPASDVEATIVRVMAIARKSTDGSAIQSSVGAVRFKVAFNAKTPTGTWMIEAMTPSAP